jgi:hypothetical protein
MRPEANPAITAFAATYSNVVCIYAEGLIVSKEGKLG